VNFQWRSLIEVDNLLAEFKRFNGEWPPGKVFSWETTTHMRQRVFNVFRKYLAYQRVLEIYHGRLMRTITGVEEEKTALASFLSFQMDE
jgi:hypothetical protein